MIDCDGFIESLTLISDFFFNMAWSITVGSREFMNLDKDETLC
jgi:hypothetical protein